MWYAMGVARNRQQEIPLPDRTPEQAFELLKAAPADETVSRWLKNVTRQERAAFIELWKELHDWEVEMADLNSHLDQALAGKIQIDWSAVAPRIQRASNRLNELLQKA